MSCCNSDEENNSRLLRRCTDVFALCFFIAFICVLMLIAAFGIVYGNPSLLLNGYDSFGNICGNNNEMTLGALSSSDLDMTDRPYLFHLDIENIDISLKICVKQCPNQNLNSIEELEKFYQTTHSLLCRYDFNFTNFNDFLSTANDTAANRTYVINSPVGPCPSFPVYKSEAVLQRCVPSAPVNVDVLTSLLNSPAALEQLISGLYSTWPHILLLTFFSFVVSLILVLLLRIITCIMAWIFMVTVTISSLGGTGLLWWTYIDRKWVLDETPTEKYLIEVDQRNVCWLLALSIIASIITVILLALVVHVAKHISRLIKLFEEASNCFKGLPSLLMQPAITVCVLLLTFCIWLYVVLCLTTATSPEAKPLVPFKIEKLIDLNSSDHLDYKTEKDKTFTLLGFSESTWIRYCWWVYLIALIWVSELILSCQQMTTAGAVVNWYFDKNRLLSKTNYLGTSVRRLISYHLGSVVLGSFLILLCKVPRLILRFFNNRFQTQNSCGRKTCCCCFYCYERGLRVVNHNAYAVIAIEGLNFCPAAHIAYQTMQSSTLQFAAINSVGDCLLFLGKCSVTAITGCLGLLLMKSDPQLHSIAVPLLILCAFSFYVSHAVFTLYEMVIDSLFLCVAEDRALSISENCYYRPNITKSLTFIAKNKINTTETGTIIERQPIRQ